MQVCRCAVLHVTWAAVFARIACMYASVHRCLCNYAFIYLRVYPWLDLLIFGSTYQSTYRSIYVCMHVHMCVCAYIMCVCLYMRMRMRMYVCVYIARKEARKHKHVRLQVCFATTRRLVFVQNRIVHSLNSFHLPRMYAQNILQLLCICMVVLLLL